MTMALKPIKTTRDEYADKCVETLQDAAEACKKEPMKCVVILTLSQAGDYDISYTALNRLELMGALELMKAKVAE